jgi:hypothetical protein
LVTFFTKEVTRKKSFLGYFFSASAWGAGGRWFESSHPELLFLERKVTKRTLYLLLLEKEVSKKTYFFCKRSRQENFITMLL